MSDLGFTRGDFPILSREVAGRPLVYFDNAATSLTPECVIEAVANYYRRHGGNIHRGKHLLSEEASDLYEASRRQAAGFIGSTVAEVVFVRGTTEAINLVAAGLQLQEGDNVVGTVLEHHSNILPYSSRCSYRAAGLLDNGLPDLEEARRLIDDRTRLVAVSHCSNVTGVVVPVKAWAAMAHSMGVPLLVDAAQSAGHLTLDVHDLDCDFLAFSGHKACGPTGAGVLFGKRAQLERLVPPALGGGAVSRVDPDYSHQLRTLPWRLEAGTPDIAAVIGLGAALSYLDRIGLDRIHRHNQRLCAALDKVVASLDGAVRLSPAPGVERVPIASFTLPVNTSLDRLSRILSDSHGVMTRAGHHCAHPLHAYFDAEGSLRVSLQFYNTEEELERFAEAMRSLAPMFRRRLGA